MTQNPLIVGVMGGGSADNETTQNAYQQGKLFAAKTPEEVIAQIEVLFPENEGAA